MNTISRSLLLLTGALVLNTTLSNTGAFQHQLTGWYPIERSALTTKLTELDKLAQQHYYAPQDKKIRALIVPHAGYIYSGTVAAAAYRLLDTTAYDNVIAICPTHMTLFDGIALPTFNQYQMPLGTVTINWRTIKKLSRKEPFVYNDRAFVHEHAIEIQLPLLQHYLRKFTLVPLVIGNVTEEQIKQAAHALKTVINSKTLIIISSDFTHYGKRFNYTPFGEQQALRIQQLDNQAIRHIQNQDSEKFKNFIDKTGATICGEHAIKLLLKLLEQDVFGVVEPRIIAYAQSADLHDNIGDSVSYAAITFTNQKLDSLPAEKQFNQFERTELLRLARFTLENLFQETIAAPLREPISTPALRSTRGAFVTLKVKQTHNLRGCIGTMVGLEPLPQTIARLTKDAALHDTRFNPISAQEIPNLSIEISILTVPKRIKNTNEIVLGTHGVILHHEQQQAVYLPEVAPEQGWDLPSMLDSLSQKAGLSTQAWHDPETWFEIFESIKWSEPA